MDDGQFRAFVTDAKERAAHFSAASYVSADVRAVILDLVKICDSYDAIVSDTAGMSADSRILKKKYDGVKAEARLLEQRLEALKKKMADMIDFVIRLSPETSKMPPDVGGRVSTTLQNMAKAITDAGKI